MPDPISDEELAELRTAAEMGLSPKRAGPILALLARLDAAEAALVPEGVVTLDGQRFTVVRPSRHSTRCYLVPYRPEDTKGAGYE